jgi:RNA polymerase sigma-70 factor, ECF subfamily
MIKERRSTVPLQPGKLSHPTPVCFPYRYMRQTETLAMAESALADHPPDTGTGFADLVRRHQSMVFSIALHFLADRSAAEELAQDVFLQLHANLPTLKSEDHVTFWLRKVTAHRCIDYKRRRRLPQVSLEEVAEPSAPTPAWDPLFERKLRYVIASLPEKARLIMILRYQEDLGSEDIAEALSIPVATVKSHLRRSLALLREKLLRSIGEVTI